MKPSKNLILFAVTGLSILLAPLLGQMPVTSQRLLLAMGMNAKRMTQYEWKQRVTVIRRGNPSEPIISQVRFDSTGQMQRTTISAPPQKQTGGLRGRMAANVKENVKDIMELAGSYNKPQQMMEAVKKAQISQTPGAVRLQSSGLIKPQDSMVMLLDPSTHLATHVDIKTDYEGGPMTIAQDYSPIPDGPNMMKSMRVSAPEKGIVVHVDSYDFNRQSAQSIR